jgi:hypothetical protein
VYTSVGCHIGPAVSAVIITHLTLVAVANAYFTVTRTHMCCMQAIRREIADIANGRIKVEDSPLKAAPHTWDMCFKDEWTKPYTREQVPNKPLLRTHIPV